MRRSPRVLVVEDDILLRSMLRQLLAAEGMQVWEAWDARSMYNFISQLRLDLVLLDLPLRDEDGLSALRRLRPSFDGHIIISSSRNDLIERVTGLEAGADDYVCKPVHPRELLARVRAVLRRRPSIILRSHERSEILMFEGFVLNIVERRLVSPAGDELKLTSHEFELLCRLATHPGQTLSRDELRQHVSKRGKRADNRSVDQQMSHLRRKLESRGIERSLIRTVHGIGYVFASRITAL